MNRPALNDPVSLAPRAYVEVDLDALCANYRALAAASPGAEPGAVVKCDGYGLGAGPAAAALAAAGCRSFFVAYPEEGAILRAALAPITDGAAAIYVFNGPHADTVAFHREHRLTPILNSLHQASLWAEAAPGAPAALHVDTGMNRLGAPPEELDAIAGLGLNLVLIVSHLACPSDPAHPMNARQRARFEAAAARFPGVPRSLSASAGALLPAPYHYELTRLGVGLYGVSPLDDPDAAPGGRMKPVARLLAPVLQLREAAAGESAGYACTHVFESPRRLATAALGYGDGFLRAGGNRARAFVGGAPCPVVGRISMDLTVLDVTDAPEPVRIGDRAEFFGAHIAIEDAAAACGTIGYELLTSLGARLPRRYVWKSAPAGWGGPEGTA